MHKILGHASPEVIEHVEGHDITMNNTVQSPNTISCESCSLAKATEVVSRRTGVEEPENGTPFDRVVWDMISLNEAYNGHRYVSHFQCRQTKFNMVYTHAKKTDSLAFFEKTWNLIENVYGGKVRFIRLDGETSLGELFERFVIARGVKAERSAPNTPAQNGGAERSGRVITTKARTMRIEANLPTNMWPEAYMAAGYISNRTPVKGLGWKTPFEAVQQSKPGYAHMHPYGCRAYALIHRIPRNDKLDPRAHVGYLVGYDSTNIYRIWVPSRGKVIRTRDVTFDDTQFYDPSALDVGAVLREHVDNIIETLCFPELQCGDAVVDDDDILDSLDINVEVDVPAAPVHENAGKKSPDHTSRDNTPPRTHLPTPSRSPIPSATPRDDATVHVERSELPLLPEGDDNIGFRPPVTDGKSASRQNEISSSIDAGNIVHGPRIRHPSRRWQAHFVGVQQNEKNVGFHAAFYTAANAVKTKPPHRDTLPPAPKSWKQMQKHIHAVHFNRAAVLEFQTLLEKGTFQYIELAEADLTIPPLPLMWVFSYKFDPDGYLLKHKARLVARGDLQSTKEDTYAATLAAQTFRALMAITATFDLDIRQYDAVNAFANAHLPKPLVCECAEGFIKLGMLLRVHRALYGLKTSPLLWYKDLTDSLQDLGLDPIPDTDCLFVNDWLILIFYVDDILAVYSAKNKHRMDEFESRMLHRYDMRTISEADHFLGIRIVRNRAERKIWLVQDSYIAKMAEKFNVTVNTIPKTPLPTTELVPYENNATPEQIFGYQQKVGSLNFAAVISRPDIAKAVSKLAQFLQNPSPLHMGAADQCLAYITGTKNWAIEYNGKFQGERIFVTTSDSAFADDINTRHSSYGFCFSLYGGVIQYKAVRGRTVTTSSTEAELLAISFTAREYVAWIRFFQHIQFDLEQETTIYCDNQQTIRLLTKETPRLQTALKHVDIHQCWLRQEVQSKKIKVEWIATADMVADGLTKMLSPQKHAEFVRQLNLVDISEQL
jgi:hypothetical protein